MDNLAGVLQSEGVHIQPQHQTAGDPERHETQQVQAIQCDLAAAHFLELCGAGDICCLCNDLLRSYFEGVQSRLHSCGTGLGLVADALHRCRTVR